MSQIHAPCLSHFIFLNLIHLIIISQRYIDLNPRLGVDYGYVSANPLCCTPTWRVRIEPRPSLESGKEYTAAVHVVHFGCLLSHLCPLPLPQIPRLTKSPSPAESRGANCFNINHFVLIVPD